MGKHRPRVLTGGSSSRGFNTTGAVQGSSNRGDCPCSPAHPNRHIGLPAITATLGAGGEHLFWSSGGRRQEGTSKAGTGSLGLAVASRWADGGRGRHQATPPQPRGFTRRPGG